MSESSDSKELTEFLRILFLIMKNTFTYLHPFNNVSEL